MLLVPYTLQVGCLSSGLRTAYEQVAAVVEHKLNHSHIVASGEGAQTGLCGEGSVGTGGKIQVNPVVLVLVCGDTALEQFLVGKLLRCGQPFCILGRCVPAYIVIVHEIGGGGNEKQCLCGIADVNLVPGCAYRTVGDNPDYGLFRKLGVDSFVGVALDNGHKVVAGCFGLKRKAGVVRQRERALLVLGKADNHHFVRY